MSGFDYGSRVLVGIVGCGLMFSEVHKVGGAGYHSRTQGIIGQVTFSFWVPSEWAEWVDTRCDDLAAEMAQRSSFPKELIGEYKNAADEKRVKHRSVDLLKNEFPEISDIDLEGMILYFQAYTESVRHLEACVLEKARRDGMRADLG
jgi:hypothetical protein